MRAVSRRAEWADEPTLFRDSSVCRNDKGIPFIYAVPLAECPGRELNNVGLTRGLGHGRALTRASGHAEPDKNDEAANVN